MGSNFVTVSIMFNAVISIDDEKKLEDLIFRETDWIGEPKTDTGCVVNIMPKKFKINGREEIVESPQELEQVEKSCEKENFHRHLPVVKGFKIDDGKLIKNEEKIVGALKMKSGVTLVLSTKKGMLFESIDRMIGKEVVVNRKGSDVVIKVGEV